MQQAIIDFITNYGYIAVCLLICIENVFPPIPSELILVFGGFAATSTNMSILWTILAATLGSVVGAIILYMAGRKLGRKRVLNLLGGRLGKILFLKPEKVEKASEAFAAHQDKTVLICRCIPVLRSLISIPAGIEGMNFSKFIALTVIGSTVWNSLLVCLGAFTKNSWQTALAAFERYSNIILIVLITVLVIYLLASKLRKRK